MRHCVVLDSCFITAALLETDVFHSDARFVLKKLLRATTEVKIIVPPIALYETISNLVREGVTHRRVEATVMRLLKIEKIIILSITEASAFKHARKLLQPGNPASTLRTADFLISCVGLDFEAQILTFDRKVFNRIRTIYPSIYYCSDIGGYHDDTPDFLYELKALTP